MLANKQEMTPTVRVWESVLDVLLKKLQNALLYVTDFTLEGAEVLRHIPLTSTCAHTD